MDGLTGIAPAITDWLAELVRERVSPGLGLRFDPPAGWRLEVPGSAQAVVIAAAAETYGRLVCTLPAGAPGWQPRAEGWAAPLAPDLPLPGAAAVPQPLTAAIPGGWRIGFDLLWFALWSLSRAEETASAERDAHGRFPAAAAHALRHGYLRRPLVDEWFAILRQIVRRVWPELPLAEHGFRLALSHDVDEPCFLAGLPLPSMLRRAAGDILHRRRPGRGLAAPFRWLAVQAGVPRADPFDTFAWLMARAERRGLTGVFHFLAGRTDPRFDRAYDVGEPRLRRLLAEIHARGHRVGLHPSYGAFCDAGLIRAEAARLRRECESLGIPLDPLAARMHFLRWDTPATPRALAAAGVASDNSLGYAEQVGFRCGTCLDYRAFDPVAIEAIDLRIQPLVAMDVTFLAGGAHLRLDTPAALALLTALKDACRAVGGCFTLCWHNSELETRAKRALFESVLEA